MTATVGSEVAAAGDEVARLYDLYAPKLRRFCRGRLRCAEDADDAVQTVFLRVYTALRGGTAPVYEAAWLYKIAHNVCLSRIESRAARARVEQPHDLDLLQDVLAAPGERHDELVGLADALAAMPANLRQAILLREWQGLSYAEIAEALGVSASAVETLIFRARKHLAAALERGVAGPARSVVTILQLPWLLRRLRPLLTSGRGAELGAAKLSAAVVLTAAVAGGGVATGVLASRTPAHSVTPPAGASALAPVAPTLSTTTAASLVPAAPAEPVAPRPTRRAAATATRIAGAISVGPTAIAPQPTFTIDPPRAVAPGASPSPGTLPSPGTGAPPSPVTTLPAATTSTLARPATALPAPAVPTVSTPRIAVPTVAVPTVPLPTVSVPVAAPTVSTPVVTTPAVSTPPVTTPVVTTPVATPPSVTVGLPAPALP